MPQPKKPGDRRQRWNESSGYELTPERKAKKAEWARKNRAKKKLKESEENKMTHFKLQDMQQIVESNPNAWWILSDHFGVTIGGLRTMLEEGKVNQSEAMQVFRKDNNDG